MVKTFLIINDKTIVLLNIFMKTAKKNIYIFFDE